MLPARLCSSYRMEEAKLLDFFFCRRIVTIGFPKIFANLNHSGSRIILIRFGLFDIKYEHDLTCKGQMIKLGENNGSWSEKTVCTHLKFR